MFFSDKETKAESQDHSLAASEWSGTENYKAKSRALITNLLCLTKERKKKKKTNSEKLFGNNHKRHVKKC